MQTTKAAPEDAATDQPTTPTIPEYPRGGDPRRRMRLHYLLVQRRRVSNALDHLLDATTAPEAAVTASEAVTEEVGDWWRDIGMHLGYEERDAAGRRHPWRLIA